MMLVMQILAVIGIGIVVFAIIGLFASKPETVQKPKIENQPPPREDLGKEQKIQRLQSQQAELEIQLEKSKAEYLKEEAAFMKAKENEVKLLEELKRRDEWLAKAEAELAKIKLENSDLSNKFIVKEKELEAEFTNNVNLTRGLNEIKSALAEKEMGSRLKEDQLQAQKHQIEDQLKTIQEQLVTIAQFNKKEKISEWVPKTEFNKLNEEYSQLEKDLESSQERLKTFAEEIAHLRQEVHKKTLPAENINQKEAKSIVKEGQNEETKPDEIKEETKAVPEDIKSEKNKPEEIKQNEVHLLEKKASPDNIERIEENNKEERRGE